MIETCEQNTTYCSKSNAPVVLRDGIVREIVVRLSDWVVYMYIVRACPCMYDYCLYIYIAYLYTVDR